MKIGLVGEAPNDTSAIQNLLSRKYQQLEFVTLLNNITGSLFVCRKAIRRLLRVEYETQNPDMIIFIRDLDALEGNRSARRKRQEVFSYSNRVVDRIGIFLLNIFELEALILSDIDVFNNYYNSAINVLVDPMTIPMPKEFLIEATKGPNQYQESHSPLIFALLNFDTLKQNCRYFSAFVRRFERGIDI